MADKALIFAELAVGIVFGMVVWSYAQPMLSGVSAVPSA